MRRNEITYPCWRVRGSPTQLEKLIICDGCSEATWTIYVQSHVAHCPRHGRMREATKHEYAAAKRALT